MDQFSEILESEDQLLLEEIVVLIDHGNYDSALGLIRERLAQDLDASTLPGAYVKAKLASALIDIANEGCMEKAAKEGIYIYENDRDHFKKLITEASIEYNLGNGKGALFRAKSAQKNFRIKPETIELLTEEKNHFWRAYKLFGLKDDGLRPQLLVNLAGALKANGRLVEALQYYDSVLAELPDFPEANANRANALLWLYRISDTYSIVQLQQAVANFDVASKASNRPEWVVEKWREESIWPRSVLKEHGHSGFDAHDFQLTQEEAKAHSEYRQFCLENHLTLSEHSLYCNCVGARRDDLTIPKTTKSIGGDFVPRMELMLNRLKSEYALARLLYFQLSINPGNAQNYDGGLAFTELHEDEVIGTRSEMVRTSFRLCFGVLDKIGRAICDLFELADPKEPIYFESFWRPRGNKLSEKQRQRWAKINSIDNYSLLALYSQATDLNSNVGEWGIFKAWRNDLEHEMLILTSGSKEPHDPYEALAGDQPLRCVQYEDFTEKTLHLLQLTRSAIFNFVFCVRSEGQNALGEEANPTTLDFKSD